MKKTNSVQGVPEIAQNKYLKAFKNLKAFKTNSTRCFIFCSKDQNWLDLGITARVGFQEIKQLMLINENGTTVWAIATDSDLILQW